MKKVIVISFLVLLANLSHAEDKDSKFQACDTASTLAKSIMGARQKGAEMKWVIGKIKDKDSPLGKLAISLTEEAYSEPRFNTESNQQQAVTDFENEIYLACLKQFKK